jgi:hypothetical protein
LRIRVAQLEQARPNHQTDKHSATRAAALVFRKGDRIQYQQNTEETSAWNNTIAWDQL